MPLRLARRASRGARRQQSEPRQQTIATGGGDQSSSELRHSPENSDFVMNPRAGADSSRVAIGARPAARDEDDRGAGRLRGEDFRHREAVHARQLDVQQHDLRTKAPGLLHRRLAVGGLTEDVEPVGLQQRSRAAAEAGVVIHDQDGPGHGVIVPRGRDRLRQRGAEGSNTDMSPFTNASRNGCLSGAELDDAVGPDHGAPRRLQHLPVRHRVEDDVVHPRSSRVLTPRSPGTSRSSVILSFWCTGRSCR